MFFLLTGLIPKPYGAYLAAGVFVIAASTDGFDGYIARKRKEVTNFGKFIDPLADKLLVTAALLVLIELNKISSWIAMIIISREFVVTTLRIVAASEGIIIAASFWGKIKTIVQIVAIVSIILDNYPFNLINFRFDLISIAIAVIITILSGIEYIVKNKEVVNIK
jgi:CDP-diacylglycerol--glycerol-3-phosphate 3-phosphatidyltransferase